MKYIPIYASILASVCLAKCPQSAVFSSCTVYADPDCSTEIMKPDGTPQDDDFKKNTAAGISTFYEVIKETCTYDGKELWMTATCTDDYVSVDFYEAANCTGTPVEKPPIPDPYTGPALK